MTNSYSSDEPVQQTDIDCTAEVQADESEETTITANGFQTLDRRQITISRIGSLIGSTGLSVVVFLAVVFSFFALGLDWTWYLLAGLGVLTIVFLFWWGYRWPVWEFERTSWRLDENGLEIHRGVFWRHKISVPAARVQHADVSQGPLQRHFELGKLTVHTAGTQNASVELGGIAHSTAIGIRDQIVNQRKSVDVV